MTPRYVMTKHMHGNDEVRSELARLQRRARTDPGDVPLDPLVSAIEHRDDAIVERAVTVLYVVSQATPVRVREAVPQLAPLLGSDRSTIRSKTVLTLSNVAEEHPEAVRPCADGITDALDDRSQTVARGAVDALERLALDDPSIAVDAVPRVTALLAADIEETRRNAAAVLELVCAEYPGVVAGSVETLVELLEDPYRTLPSDVNYDPHLAADGSSPAEQMGGYQSLVADQDGRESNVRARESAARVIATFAEADPATASDVLDPHLPRLFDRLEDRNPAIRAAIARSLAYVAQERPEAVRPAEEALIGLLEDPIAVSGNAVWALRYVRSERAIDALIALVDRKEAPPSTLETAKTVIEELESDTAGADETGQ